MSPRKLSIAFVLFLAACGAEDMTSKPAPQDFDGAGNDAFGARPGDPARVAQLQDVAKHLIKPNSVMQVEPRLGVPTFLWAKPALVKTSRAKWVTAGTQRPEVSAARGAVRQYASLYGLTADDITYAKVAHVDTRANGAAIVKLRSEVGGIEVFREEMNVLLDANLDPVSISGYIAGLSTPPARAGAMDFQLAAPDSAARALKHMASVPVDASLVTPIGRVENYEYFDLASSAGVKVDEPVRMKKVYFRLPAGLEAAYYLEVIAHTGAPDPTTIDINGNVNKTLEAYAYVVSAATGQLLWRKNMIQEDFSYRVFADPVTKIPYDTPSGNAPHPKVIPLPDGAQAPFVPPADVTLNNFPYSMNDPWLPTGATETVGNNVDAFVNLQNAANGADNGYGPIAPPADPASGDFRAQLTGPGQFLHTNDPATNPGLAEGRQGAIQQLFYNINFLHDWYYDAGFNESAGNAQTDNFGRGGLGNDSILGQAQDASSFSNANMLTGADGARPRMRMYNFPSPANHLGITAPAGFAKMPIGLSQTGPQGRTDLTANIVRAVFTASPACDITNAAALAGAIALFDFDNTDGTGCTFGTRITKINATGAVAVLMSWQQAAPNQLVNITGLNPTHTKPIATIRFADRNLIDAQLTGGQTVTARLLRDHHFDGTVDNQIVFHEWMHYSSNRLVGNGTGLSSLQGVGMGEGWGDFNALMLTVRPDDTTTPSNPTFNGAYALATHALGGIPFDGSPNDNFYFGIRRYPYSTDTAINPLTFKHIADGVPLPVGPPVAFGADGAQNSEVHNTGEVWTTMLWECYANILQDTLGATPRLTFQQAQDRMKLYVIGGLKLTPVMPTFTEARDGVLAMAFATDPLDYLACKRGFTKRGAGTYAVAPDRLSGDNNPVVEDFAIGSDLEIVDATLDDSFSTCDADGVVDHGEYGKLTITVRNTGLTTLTGSTGTVATTSAGIWFPSGTALTFPAIVPGATGSASVRIALPPTSTGIQAADFNITVTNPALTTPAAPAIASFRLDTDEVPASSATDTVEANATAWTASAGLVTNLAPWQRVQVSALDRRWYAIDPAGGSDQRLTSPVFTVDGSGSVNIQFDHVHAFEFDGGGNYDGGAIEMSVNGGAFTDIGGPAYNGTILNQGPANLNPLQGRPGFVQNGGGHVSLTQAVAPGSTVQIRFRLGSDNFVGAPGWLVDNIAFTGVVETPFATVVPDAGASCDEVPTSADLAITKTNGTTSVTAGMTTTYTLVASNAGPKTIIGATVSDVIPPELTSCTWTCTGAGGATCGSGTGNVVDQITLPVGGTATYSVGCTVSVSTPSLSVSNTATIANPGPVTDPNTANNSATDTDTLVHLPAHLFGSKTVAGTFTQGGTVIYTVILGNDGTGIQFDNAGAEFTDVLPAELTLISASATSGTASSAGNTVTWNGSIAVNAAVTITITATINAAAGTEVTNQGTFAYDNDGNGTNEATGVTDAFPCPP